MTPCTYTWIKNPSQPSNGLSNSAWNVVFPCAEKTMITYMHNPHNRLSSSFFSSSSKQTVVVHDFVFMHWKRQNIQLSSRMVYGILEKEVPKTKLTACFRIKIKPHKRLTLNSTFFPWWKTTTQCLELTLPATQSSYITSTIKGKTIHLHTLCGSRDETMANVTMIGFPRDKVSTWLFHSVLPANKKSTCNCYQSGCL